MKSKESQTTKKHFNGRYRRRQRPQTAPHLKGCKISSTLHSVDSSSSSEKICDRSNKDQSTYHYQDLKKKSLSVHSNSESLLKTKGQSDHCSPDKDQLDSVPFQDVTALNCNQAEQREQRVILKPVPKPRKRVAHPSYPVGNQTESSQKSTHLIDPDERVKEDFTSEKPKEDTFMPVDQMMAVSDVDQDICSNDIRLSYYSN